MQGQEGEGLGLWIGSKTAPKKRKWVVENLLWMGEMKQDREGYLMKIMRHLVKLDNISDILMKFFHFELPCV
jgi:ABC-type transport system involved in cytochrome c biogenesis ATPase subunit